MHISYSNGYKEKQYKWLEKRLQKRFVNWECYRDYIFLYFTKSKFTSKSKEQMYLELLNLISTDTMSKNNERINYTTSVKED